VYMCMCASLSVSRPSLSVSLPLSLFSLSLCVSLFLSLSRSLSLLSLNDSLCVCLYVCLLSPWVSPPVSVSVSSASLVSLSLCLSLSLTVPVLSLLSFLSLSLCPSPSLFVSPVCWGTCVFLVTLYCFGSVKSVDPVLSGLFSSSICSSRSLLLLSLLHLRCSYSRGSFVLSRGIWCLLGSVVYNHFPTRLSSDHFFVTVHMSFIASSPLFPSVGVGGVCV
jgi:hypothetical protein